jgi:hypothetical protein
MAVAPLLSLLVFLPPVCIAARATSSWQTYAFMAWVYLGQSGLKCSGWCVMEEQ